MTNQKHEIEWEFLIGGAAPEDEMVSISVTFEGEIEPYQPMIPPGPATAGEPPEGGFVRLLAATLAHTVHAKHDMSWLLDVLPEAELTAIAERLYDEWEARLI